MDGSWRSLCRSTRVSKVSGLLAIVTMVKLAKDGNSYRLPNKPILPFFIQSGLAYWFSPVLKSRACRLSS